MLLNSTGSENVLEPGGNVAWKSELLPSLSSPAACGQLIPEPAGGLHEVRSRSSAVEVETLTATVLFTIVTFEASSRKMPPPKSAAALLTTMLLRTSTRYVSGRSSEMP